MSNGAKEEEKPISKIDFSYSYINEIVDYKQFS
jgi:hypothetical protein